MSHRFKSIVKFFTNSPQYENVNIANFVLAVALKMNKTKEVYNLEYKPIIPVDI